MRPVAYLLVLSLAALSGCKKPLPTPPNPAGPVGVEKIPAVSAVETPTSSEPAFSSDTAENQRARPRPRPPQAPKPPEPEVPIAAAAPGKQGYVFSPYNNKVIDVRDIPSGTMVMDPTYPEAEQKMFRVP